MEKLIIIAVILGFIISCDDILNIEPQSSVTTANMWQSESDTEGAMNGMYRQFRGSMNMMFRWGDLRTGFYGRGLSMRDTDIFENNLNATSSGTNWEDLYTTINDANLILKYVPGIEFSNQEDKDNILANAYFIRAICYYYIARVWGDAPLLLEGFESAEQEGLEPERFDVSEIFVQVGRDIESALDLIPNGASSRLYASRSAVKMLQTDYSLWMAKTQGAGTESLETAQAAVDDVLASNYRLLDSYEEVFRNDENDEIIFSIRFEREEGPSNYFGQPFLLPNFAIPHDSLANNPLQYGSHSQWYKMTEEHQDFLYEDSDDSRAYINYAVHVIDGEKYDWINKYLGEFSEGTRYHNSDTKFYRLAEAYLFKAEVENALGNQSVALDYVNDIAERAYGQENYYSGTYSQEELDEIILDERIKELATEGKSWFDLIRFDKAFERVWSLNGREGEENILLWPVHQNSINTNPNIEQTPGY